MFSWVYRVPCSSKNSWNSLHSSKRDSKPTARAVFFQTIWQPVSGSNQECILDANGKQSVIYLPISQKLTIIGGQNIDLYIALTGIKMRTKKKLVWKNTNKDQCFHGCIVFHVPPRTHEIRYTHQNGIPNQQPGPSSSRQYDNQWVDNIIQDPDVDFHAALSIKLYNPFRISKTPNFVFSSEFCKTQSNN